MIRRKATACAVLAAALAVASPASAKKPRSKPTKSACERVTLEGVTVDLTLEGISWGGWSGLCRSLTRYLRPGAQPVDPKMAPTAERLLTATGYFSKASCTTAPDRLSCTLVPQRMVYAVDIAGDIPFGVLKDDLRRRIFLRPGTLLEDEPQTLARQRKRLEDYLRRQGYFGSVVMLAGHTVDEAEPNQGVRLDAVVRPGRTVSLRRLTVRGTLPKGVTKADLRAALTHDWFLFWFPQQFRPAEFQDDLDRITRRLQSRGYPEAQVTGTWNLDLGHGKVDIVLRVHTGPKLVLRVTGNRHIRSKVLVGLGTFTKVGVIDPVEIEDTANAIKRHYQEAGYYAVQVTPRTQSPDEGTFVVIYAIDEGPKASITKVRFEGNTDFGAATIRRNVSLLTRKGGFLSPGRWIDAAAQADARGIQAFYVSKGYGAAKVTATRRPLGKGRLEAIFHVDEGQRRMVRSMTITGLPKEVDEKALDKRLALVAGKPFYDDALGPDQREIVATLAAAGYSRADVKRDLEAPKVADGGPVTIAYRVTPGPRALFGGVLIRGNFRTVDSLIDGELNLEPGDPLDIVALGRARRRLRSLGPFSSVELKPLDLWRGDPETWMLVAIEERNVTALDAVLSYSTDEGFGIGFDYRDRNLFGRAIRLDLNLRTGAFGGFDPAVRIGNADSVDATVSAPHPLGVPFDVQGTAFYRYQDLPRYTERRVGITAGAVRQLLSRKACPICPDITGTLRYEVTAGELDDHTQRFIAFSRSYGVPQANIGRIVPALRFDRRDSFVDPRHGYAGDLRFELAAASLSPIGNGSSFWRLLASGQGYVDLGAPFSRRVNEKGLVVGGPIVLALGFSYGAARPFGASRAIPDSESFYYGGDFSVRGIEDRASLVAFPGADYLVSGSVEARWYFLQNVLLGSFQLALFSDLGTVAYNLPELFQSTTVTVGASLRYVTPVGPIAVSYGIAVLKPAAIIAQRPEAIPSAGRVHVTFGYPF